MAFISMIGRLARASIRPMPRPSLECRRLWRRRRRHSLGVRSSAWTARSVCWLIVSGLGNERAVPSASRIVMSSERNWAPCSRRQPEDRPGLPGVGPGRQHDAHAVDGQARRVQEDLALGDRGEPQQSLDDVGVDDVRRLGEHRGHGHVHRVAELHAEAGPVRSQVLLVGRDAVTAGDLRPGPHPAHLADADLDAGRAGARRDPEVLQLGKLDLRSDAHDAADLVVVVEPRGLPHDRSLCCLRHGFLPRVERAVDDHESGGEDHEQGHDVGDPVVQLCPGDETCSAGILSRSARLLTSAIARKAIAHARRERPR